MRYKTFLVFLFFTLVFAGFAWAVPVSLDSVAYWDVQVDVGSGTGIGNGTIAEDGDTHLPPDPPAGNPLPDSKEYEVFDPDGYMYAYASYGVETDWIDVFVNGFAIDKSTSNTEWFSTLSKVASRSESFTGVNAFSISFDWEFTVNWGGGDGEAKIGFGLLDYTDPSDPHIFYSEVWLYDPLDSSGTYTWSTNALDPTHVYLFGIGAKAFLEGIENSEGSIDVYIHNINADISRSVIPEPASVLLVGAGLLALGIWGRRKQ